MKNTKVIFSDIDYDTDGESVELPGTIETTLHEMEWEEADENIDDFIMDRGANFISDKTGWLVNSYNYSIIKTQS